jgi:hypothetical protein
MYERREEQPPCSTCRVTLAEENEDAAAVYMACRWQTVVTEMKATRMIDISVPAIESAIRMRGVKDQWGCLQRVVRCFHAVMNEQREG